jgi:hypothetical protein
VIPCCGWPELGQAIANADVASAVATIHLRSIIWFLR